MRIWLASLAPAVTPCCRDPPQGERQAVRAEVAPTPPEETVWNSVRKFLPKDIFRNSGDLGGEQLRWCW